MIRRINYLGIGLGFLLCLNGCPAPNNPVDATTDIQNQPDTQSDSTHVHDEGMTDTNNVIDVADTGPSDVPVDSGSTDTGPSDAGPFEAPCVPGTNYVDLPLTNGAGTITFGVSGLTYTPNCATIPVGTTVTFSGSFQFHPLAPAPNRGSPNNPITATNTGTSASFTFTTPGLYPYYCQVHGSANGLPSTTMAGVIQVVQ